MLTREDFVAVASRLFAVWLAIKAVAIIPPMLAISRAGDDYGAMSAALAMALFLVAAAIVLWTFPLTIARKLLPVMKSPGTPVTTQSAGAMELGLTLLGFWLLAVTLGDAIYWLTMAFFAIRNDMAFSDWAMEDRASALATLLELAIAFWLILGNRGLLAAFARLRGAEPA